ncbi:MAG TPA: HEPN domain-containing protein [Chloroflexota bacterium]|nr:HEPN domain-containing protein [Chloroflexota bacterium]
MTQPTSIYREKAEESLAGAVSEYANGRYNNCANRCYYSCFQAAVQALQDAGVTPPGARGEWGHDQLHATFTRELINRRKR